MDSLARLQGLHADLVAFAETRLANIERLALELEETVAEFRRLVDKPVPAAADRAAYDSGKIEVSGQEYGINEEFKHVSRAIGTLLELDEIEAGRLLIENQSDPKSTEASLVADTVSAFHNRRDLLLQTLRITFQHSLDQDLEENLRNLFQSTVAEVLDIRSGPPSNGSAFAAKCLNALEEMEKLQSRIADALLSRSVLGQPRGVEFYATLEFQRDSLFKQHESLACVVAYLFRGNYTISEDLRKLNNATKRWSKLDLYLVHYLPAFSAAFRLYGSPEGSESEESAKSLNAVFAPLLQDTATAGTRPFHAVLSSWWTVEYSGRFRDRTDQPLNSDERGTTLKSALQEDALELLLSICTTVNTDVWRHPARQELVALLLSESTGLSVEGGPSSFYFQALLMESLETFVEAFITNMPDSIRRLKTEEDERRLNNLTALQDGVQTANQTESVSKLHLECFLVLVSFAYEQRPDAASQWWEDVDSNLYGFLQWASRRQTVPRVSAFCELLCSISEDQESAESAHKFLLDDAVPIAGPRGRRVPSMNYQQIFAELQLYSRKVHERPTTTQVPNVRKVLPTDMNELESPVMLSSYLRLLAHLCRRCAGSREYILGTVSQQFPESLMVLASGPVPSYLRASVFAIFDALLTSKTLETSWALWRLIDDWASNGNELIRSLTNKPGQPAHPALTTLQSSLASLLASFDQCDAFVVLLRDLISPTPAAGFDASLLPFSNDLGSAYRSSGISPFVDFVCGQVFARRIPDMSDDTQMRIATFHCLDFIAVALEAFNDDYVGILQRSTSQRDSQKDNAVVTEYAQRSPFARLMCWLLTSECNKALMGTLDVPSDLAESALPDSPLLLSLERAIDILNRALDLQPTYFDIVRPLVQPLLSQEGNPFKSSVGSMENSIAAHPHIILSLCRYAASGHSPLALRALGLLQKLSSSEKLNNHFIVSDTVRPRSRRIIDMLGVNAEFELESVTKSLSGRLEIDERELEDGYEAASYELKDGIIAFFNSCLDKQLDLPSIAHLLLGFGQIGVRLTISNSLENGSSVFNAVANLVLGYPDDEDGNMLSWLAHIKASSIQLLRHLWSSTVSDTITLGQLRRIRFLQAIFSNTPIISVHSVWDGKSIFAPDFWFSTSAEALTEFFLFRASLFNYVATELRSAAKDGLAVHLRQIIPTLQGKTTDVDGSTLTHPDVFTLFDFLDTDVKISLEMPVFSSYPELPLGEYMNRASETSPSLYDLRAIGQALQIYQLELMDQHNRVAGAKPIDDIGIKAEADTIIGVLEARNRLALAQQARLEALHEYADMIIAMLDCCPMETAGKQNYILHTLQIILPKFDAFILDEADEVIELARIAEALMITLAEVENTGSHVDNLLTERLFQLFRVSIEGISIGNSTPSLRTMLYSICSLYLSRLAQSPATSDIIVKATKNCMDCLRSASQRLILILSDDAEDGIDACRTSALDLLSHLTSVSRAEKSNFILNALVKANMLEILIEPLKHITAEFQGADPAHRSSLLSTFQSRMFLLLQISRTREGASALLDAGLLPSIRDSLLFRADPDLGIPLPTLNVDAPTTTLPSTDVSVPTEALQTYYALLSAALRLLLSALANRGSQNEQVRYQARIFLTEYRANMVGLFKRYGGVGGQLDSKTKCLVGECVKGYTGLVGMCDFVDFEKESDKDALNGGFS